MVQRISSDIEVDMLAQFSNLCDMRAFRLPQTEDILPLQPKAADFPDKEGS